MSALPTALSELEGVTARSGAEETPPAPCTSIITLCVSHTCVRITLLESSSSEPTIDPTDKLFQRLDLLLDPRLCKGVVILRITQN